MLKRWTSALVALIAAVALASGCGKADDKASKSTGKDKPVAEKKGHDHGEWWCAEHGVPEEECTQCSKKLADACKAKGDWCKEHDVAKSQCFKCDPKLKDTYAAKYQAKFGKAPPPIEDKK